MVCAACQTLTLKLRTLRKHLLKGSDNEPLEALDEVCRMLNLSVSHDSWHLQEEACSRHSCGRLGVGDRREIGLQVDFTQLEDAPSFAFEARDSTDDGIDTARSITFEDWLVPPHSPMMCPGRERDVGIFESGLSNPLQLVEFLASSVLPKKETKTPEVGELLPQAHWNDRAQQAAWDGDRRADTDLESLQMEEAQGGREERGHVYADRCLMNEMIRQMISRGECDSNILIRLKGMPGGGRVNPARLRVLRRSMLYVNGDIAEDDEQEDDESGPMLPTYTVDVSALDTCADNDDEGDKEGSRDSPSSKSSTSLDNSSDSDERRSAWDTERALGDISSSSSKEWDGSGEKSQSFNDDSSPVETQPSEIIL